ncbi:hypothetical protein M9458_044497, partial [Cirrhinus mrigala]
MSMAALRSRLSFVRRLPSSSSRGSSSSRKGFTAATARHLGDLQVTVQNVPLGKTLRASAPPRSPVVMPKQTAPPPKSGPSVCFGAPLEDKMSISASEGEQSADEADVSAGRRPSAVAAPSEADAELSAMLLQAAKEIGLEVPKEPLPGPSRLNDWFLGTGSAAPPCSPPVPFFPEVHEELVKAWRAPYSACSHPVSSPLTTLDGGAAKGYAGIPQVERAIAVHLCPQDAATWRGHPCLPSTACRLSSALAGRAYCAAGQAATALHAMATLQVYQAKALKELHKGIPDQAVMQELRAATDFALRATKVTARSLGQVMSTLVVQEHHLWLNLAQMADVDKAPFLDAPVSQAGLFGDTVKDFAQQFSAVQKQTEAIKHILPRRETTRKSLGAQPQPARRQGRPPATPKPAPSPAEPHDAALASRCRGRRRGAAPPAAQGSAIKTRSPEMLEAALQGTITSVPPLPEEGRDLLCVLPPAIFHISGSSAPGSVPERRYASSGSDPEPTFASAGTWEEDFSPGRSSFWDQLPHRGHVGQRSADPTCGQAGGLARAPQPFPVVDPDGMSRLCDSFRGILFTSVRSDTDASVLHAEIAVLLVKDAIEPVHPAEMKSGFYSPYFIVPMKSGGLPFKMLTSKRILSCVRHQDWFAAIYLKDAYFHVSISPRHRPFLRFAFEGRANQYKVLPFGLSLSPRVFTKVAEGVHILNYLDDWLIIAHSRDLLCEHRDLVLQHLSHLGLRVNREKSKLSPVQRISFLGMELDSVNMTACLTNERTQSVLNCLKLFRHKTAVPLKTFQRLLGHMAATAAVTPLGLLHMRPLQRWLHDRVPRWAWHRGTLRIGVSQQCRRLFSPWSDPAFLRAGVPLGQVSRLVVVHTDASTTGWGAVCNGQAASGSWTGPRLLWHINCLELLAVLLALCRFLPMLCHKHVLVRTDNTATVAYINRQGGLRSRRMSQLARHLLLWSQTRLKSLRAVHIPGELNCAADQLSQQPTHPGEWRLNSQTVQLIWNRFGEAQIDLFASPESSHCQLYYSLDEAPLGRDALAHSWPPGPNLLAQTLCKIREDGEQVLLVAPYWPTRTCPSLEDPLEEGPSFSGDGHNLAPASQSVEPTRVASGRDASDLSGLPQAVIETITQQAYALRWGLFVDWCASRGEDPQRCPIAVVLSFLQEKLERRLSPSTLKVYVAAIAAYYDAVDGTSIGKHQLVVRVNPPGPHLVPSWDLSVALQGLRGPPFEPLVSVELKFLSLQTALLTALASINRVGDLQAFSVNEACLEFGPADSPLPFGI